MTQKTSNFRLGVFVVTAVVILMVLVVAVGGGNVLRRKVTVETYFDESVQGLDIGSKVRYRGVEVGNVSRIGFTYTEYEQDKAPADRKQYVLVEMAVYPELVGEVGQGQQFVDKLVKEGLRIRMAPIGVTGIVYLEVDFTRNTAMLPITWQPKHLYIPSTRSTVLSFVDAAEHLIDKLAPVDLDRTVGNIDRLLTTLNRKADALDTAKLSGDMSAALVELHGTLREVKQMAGREEWKSVPGDLSVAARRLREIAEGPELKRILAALDRSAQRIDRVMEGGEEDLSELIVNLRSASTNLRSLSENLRRDPAGTLLSEPPKPSGIYAPQK